MWVKNLLQAVDKRPAARQDQGKQGKANYGQKAAFVHDK
jgi:hypothetical protein